eukprot:185400-Amphidinium_carterae.1
MAAADAQDRSLEPKWLRCYVKCFYNWHNNLRIAQDTRGQAVAPSTAQQQRPHLIFTAFLTQQYAQRHQHLTERLTSADGTKGLAGVTAEESCTLGTTNSS